MRAARRYGTVGLIIAATLGWVGTPVGASADPPAGEPVALVVGLRPGADEAAPVNRLESRTDVDVVRSETVGDTAVAVQVPATEVAEATNALRQDPAVAYVERDFVASAAATPNDPYRSSQWGVDVTGVAAAWQRTTGSAAVTVAVVDTGVDAVSDLAGAVLPGYDFVNNDGNAADDNGHGTMTATVVAGRGNNGIVTAGVCWSCRILPVKVLGADGRGLHSNIAQGIRYSADHGADIINLSLGGPDDGQVLRDAVAYAVGKGSLVIAAAGNSSLSSPHYPAAITDVLAVGASTQQHARYEFSNYGPSWVDIAAPGCNVTQDRLGKAANFCGTSSASPFLSGVAALALSAWPTASATQIAGVLTGTAAAMPVKWVATGRVNADAAVQAAAVADKEAPRVAVHSPAHRATVRGTVVAAVGAVDNVRIHRVELWVAGRLASTDHYAPYTPGWRSGRYNGPVNLIVKAYDLAGNVATTTRYVTVDNTAPAVAVTRAPANGARVRGTVRVSANARDRSGINRVDLLVNGRMVASDSRAGYAFGVPTQKFGKKFSVRLRAYDRAGNVTYTPARTWRR